MTNMMYDEYSIALENIPRPLPVVIISHQVLEKCLGNIWKVVEKYLTNIHRPLPVVVVSHQVLEKDILKVATAGS